MSNQDMTRVLPRTRLAGIALVAAALTPLLLLSTSGQAAPPYAKATCDSKKASFLFWPQGHGDLNEPGFPEFRESHLEVYPGLRRTGFGTNTDAYADPSVASVNQNRCKVSPAEPLRGNVPNSAKRKKATNVQCRFGQKIRLAFTEVNGGTKVTGLRKDGTKVIELKILNAGSSVVYNKNRCEPKPPPK